MSNGVTFEHIQSGSFRDDKGNKASQKGSDRKNRHDC